MQTIAGKTVGNGSYGIRTIHPIRQPNNLFVLPVLFATGMFFKVVSFFIRNFPIGFRYFPYFTEKAINDNEFSTTQTFI